MRAVEETNIISVTGQGVILGEHTPCCEHELVLCIVVSSLLCVLSKTVQPTNCCLISICFHMLITGYSILGNVFQYSQSIPYVCRRMLMFEVVSMMVWASAWYLVRHKDFHMFLLFTGNIVHTVQTEYERRRESWPGPVQICYESQFFRETCREALYDVMEDDDVVVDLEHFCLAVRQITLNSHFGRGPFMDVLTYFRPGVYPKHQALSLSRWIAAMYLEEHGSEVPVYYNYNILQLPMHVNILNAQLQFNRMHAAWCTDSSSEEEIRNLKVLRASIEAVVNHLKTKDLIHPALPRENDTHTGGVSTRSNTSQGI